MTTTTPTKTRGLGRGLGTLLSNTPFDLQALSHSHDKERDPTNLPIEKLQPGKYQPRQFLSGHENASLHELAESIRAQGVIQPIIVRPVGANRYEIIAGERRWRASQLAGLSSVPVVIRDVPDNAAIAMALIENIQREDLNALEESQALKRLQDEFKLTQIQVAEAVGKSRVAVTHALRLLDLPQEVQQFLRESKIDRGHAKALLSLGLSDQSKAAGIIIEKNLSVRETEKLIQQWAPKASLHQVNNLIKPTKQTKNPTDPNIGSLERKLSDQLHTSVIIQHNAKKNRGKIMVHYRNLDILEGILSKLNVNSMA